MVNPFETPEEQCSFSALVDAAIIETGGASGIAKVTQYANQVIRECQQAGLFQHDSEELAVIATANPYLWETPPYFRVMRGVQYPDQIDFDGKLVVPDFIQPGKAQRGKRHLYYATNGSFVFGGISVGERINLAYYLWSKRFLYYARPEAADRLKTAHLLSNPKLRQAYFNIEEGAWYYLSANNADYVLTLNNPALEALYRTNSMQWLVRDHWDLVLNGTISKVFTKRGDPAKSAPYYSQYQQAKTALAQTSGLESLGR